MDDKTSEYMLELSKGRIPEYISASCKYSQELKSLCSYHNEILNFTVALTKGDMSARLGISGGHLAGSLKALHAGLRHLTWQTRQIAQGDLTQRVDFMGEFSLAFNSMVESLASARQDLIHMSTHDSLTGLYNRAYFDAELERVAKGRGYPVSFVMADIDGLKAVNDTYGHAAGDRLIIAAAAVLQDSCRGDDVVARIGGDEFAVIMTNCTREAAKAALERIRSNQAEHNISGISVVSISLGLCVADGREQIAGALLTADNQMYADKARKKSSE